MEDDFIIPRAILHQVNEFSTGGFLVVVFDEQGNPQIKIEMDSNTHVMAMETFLKRWLSVVDEVQRDIMINGGMQETGEEIEEDRPDDDDEE
tara:strand:+ start:191 stop:466 length:276 start_codon:yes stop_codon:yes gene_type:complete